MSELPDNKEDVKVLIDNLQQTNKLIRSRVVILTFFLVLMMGFSISIEQNKKEYKQILVSYDQLLRIIKPDSMKKILTQDSLKYLYSTNLGAYMSLEVLYDKLVRDSFQNPAPLYEAIEILDEKLQGNLRDEGQANMNVAGFAIPIRPIMILGPILLLLLYHDFVVIMLYRKDLEDKMIFHNVDPWRSGPDTVGHYSLGFIPHKFRYIKQLWGIIQMVILFLPVIPAIYFCMYSSTNYQTKELVGAINGICCLLILIDFLIVVDSENILGVRDISMVFTGKKPSDPSSRFIHRRERLALYVPILLGTFTTISFYRLLEKDNAGLVACVASSLLAAACMSVFSLLSVRPNVKPRIKLLWRSFAGAGFFAALFWFIIDLLACVGAIHFTDLTPMDYAWYSLAIFMAFFILKMIYVSDYSTKNDQSGELEKNA